MKNIILSIGLLILLTACRIPTLKTPASYETFKTLNDGFVNRGGTPLINTDVYHRQEYSESEYIYIFNDLEHDEGDYEKCIWGFVVDKNDPDQKAKAWQILSGKEFCKEGQTIMIFGG